MKSKSNHNAEELEKYLTGKMSDAEMHALEAESLEDEFLADALDGLAMMNAENRQENLADIKTQLAKRTQTQTKPRRVVKLSPQKQRWAASIVLILSCSAIFVLYKINLFEGNIAESATSLETHSNIEKTIQNAGAISEADEQLFKKELEPEQPEIIEEELEKEEPVESPTLADEVEEIVVFPTVTTEKKAEKTRLKAKSESHKLQAFASLPDIDLDSEIIVNETINNNSESDNTNFKSDKSSKKTEETQKDELLENDETDDFASDGFDDADPSGGDTFEVTKNQVVETPSAEKKLAKENRKIVQANKRTIAIVSFEKYLVENLHYPEEAKNNTISGIVKVEFFIRKNGKITEPKITQKLGYGCDEEAIRLVRNYKFWDMNLQEGKRTKKVIEISFP